MMPPRWQGFYLKPIVLCAKEPSPCCSSHPKQARSEKNQGRRLRSWRRRAQIGDIKDAWATWVNHNDVATFVKVGLGLGKLNSPRMKVGCASLPVKRVGP